MGKASRKKKETGTPVAEKRDLKKNSPDRSPGAPVSHIIAVILVSFAVYFNTLFNGFVFDDVYQVLRNPWIKDIKFLPTIFSEGVWSFLTESLRGNYYRPMMHVFYMFNYHVFGLSPWGFHFVNVLFHTGVSLLVFFVSRRLCAEFYPSNPRIALSSPLTIALLFAATPIHTETVAWVAGLPDLSFAFFFLLSLYFYLRYIEGSRGSYFLSLASFSVSVLCKEPALTLPVILAAHDWTLRKDTSSLPLSLKRYVPYGVVAGIYLIVRFYVLGGQAPIKSYIELNTPQLFINIFPLFSHYLEKLLFPINLNIWHVFHPISSLLQPVGILSVAVTAVFVFLTFIAYKKNKSVFFCLLLIVVPLLPAFYIRGIGGKPFAERYLYLPFFGFAILLALFFSWARSKTTKATPVLIMAFIALISVYSIGTVLRNAVWKDNYTLFADAVRKSPDALEPRNELGNALVDKGRFDEAITQFEAALKLKPDADAHNNLGNVYVMKGDTARAIEHFQAALKLKPDFKEARGNLAVAEGSKGLTDEAISNFRVALKQEPSNAEARYNMAVVYLKKGMVDEAIGHLQAALQLNPDLAEAHDTLGFAYYKQGRLNEAIQEYATYLRLGRDNPVTHKNLGDAYYAQGRIDNAEREYQTAVKLKPSFALAHDSLGNVYLRQNRFDDAAREYVAAIRTNPDLPVTHGNLGSIYLRQGRLDDALREYKTALSMKPDLSDLYFNMGVVYMKKGLKNEARKSFEKLLALKPDDAQARRALASM